MDVIRHHYSDMKRITSLSIVNTRGQYDITRPFRQDPPVLRDEGDEMWFEVPLQMWQVTTIKGHIQIFNC